MKRCVASLAYALLTSAALFAQKPGEPIPLTIHPADLPQPSLKYRLFPERGELTDGDAPTQYYRALSLFVENRALLDELRGDYWDNWLTMPLKDLPRKEVAEKVRMARQLFRELEIGSKRKQCDWQLENRSEGIGLRLPEVAGFHSIARPLAMRARLSIAEGKYAEACETLRIGYALAHHLGRGPTMHHFFAGMYIARLMTEQVETLVQQPDAPNLYWSLTVLPTPFADFKPVLHEETLWMENMFPLLKQLDATPLPEEQLKALEVKIEQVVEDLGRSKLSAADRVGRSLILAGITAEGKRELVQRYKLTAEQVAAMPSSQVAALYAYRDYKAAQEEVLKWANVPEGWKYPEYKTAQERYLKASNRLDALYFRGLLGFRARISLPEMPLAAAHADRRLAALRCIEALRRYAAQHEDKLPSALADVKDLPIPNDPLTGKAFLYAVNGDKATLMLAKPAEEKPIPNDPLIYHLTLKRGKE